MAANSERIIGLESDGSVPVTIVSGGGTGGTASSFGSNFPATGTAAGFLDPAGKMAGAIVDAAGVQVVNTHALPSLTFTGVHVPSTNTQATATKASAGAGKANVCTGFTVTLTAGASAISAAAPLVVSVIDGASGGTTYLWRSYINIPAVAGAQVSIVRSGIWLVGTAATALTVEFSAAGGTNSYESVALDGVIVTV